MRQHLLWQFAPVVLFLCWPLEACVARSAVSATLATAPSARPSEFNLDAVIESTQALAEKEARDGNFSGSILLAKDGQIAFQHQYGLSDRAASKYADADTQFRYGSLGKLFTVVAILQLMEAGKIDLNVPIKTYVPDFPNAQIANEATVGNLLSHSAGAGDFFGETFVIHRDELQTPEDYISLFGSRPPTSEPGTKREYSNFGFMIMGRIIEVVSGMTYSEYIETRIFEPAGMHASGFRPESDTVPDRATAYLTLGGEIAPVTAESLKAYRAIHGEGYLEYRGGPAGGGYATAEDLLKFGNALMSGKILGAETLLALTTGRVTLKDGTLVGYDYGGRLPDGKRFIGHAGAAPGQCANFRIYLASGYTVIVLSNRDAPSCWTVFDFISDQLPQ